MAKKASLLLVDLERVKTRYGSAWASQKVRFIRELARKTLHDADKVRRFHEVLCFLRAYPDDRAVLRSVESALKRFADRRDVRRFRSRLTNSGIAGADIEYPFYWFMSRWLARSFPDSLSVDWSEFENESRLEQLLHLLVTYSETPGLDELNFTLPEWIDRLKGDRETDAVFLVRRFEALTTDSFGRETFFEQFDIPMRLSAGPRTPSRTHAKYGKSKVVYQTRPLSTVRPSLGDEIPRPPVGVREVSPREAGRLIQMAHEAMVTRSRDLDVFVHADPNDVRIIDCGEGLEFVCYGVVPERRLLLESVYGYLTLKNGVPTGYVLSSQLFQSAGVAYNVFDTYRGTESAVTYTRFLSLTRFLFGADSFYVDPYQLGHDNEEGLQSGAWWFYYKLGFRPEDRGVRRVLQKELGRLERNPHHRSSVSTLQKLTAENMYFYMNRRREDILGKLGLGQVGLRISRFLAKRFGSEREKGIDVCSREAAELLGVRSLGRFGAGERLAWERWSPLVLILPGVDRWTAAERRALVGVMRAKGGRRESAFVRCFDGHRKLRRALAKLTGDI